MSVGVVAPRHVALEVAEVGRDVFDELREGQGLVPVGQLHLLDPGPVPLVHFELELLFVDRNQSESQFLNLIIKGGFDKQCKAQCRTL